MTRVSLVVPLLLASCATDQSSDGPPLTPEEEAALQDQVSGAGGKADGFGLTTYSSQYVNLVVSGQTAAGQPFALVAGKHEKNFPYFNTADWDSMLLLVGDQAVSITTKDVPDLTIDLDRRRSTGPVHVAYSGAAQRADGTTAQVAFDLNIGFTRYATQQLGKQYNVLNLPGIAGLAYQPFGLEGTNAGTVTIDGATSSIAAVAGQLEHGDLTNFKAPELAIRYDYIALGYAGTAVDSSQWYGHVTFTSHALYGDTLLGKVLEWYLAQSASGSMTFHPAGEADGNDRGLDLDGPVVITSHHVDLGIADLERQLVKTTDSSYHWAYGLREIFTRK